MAKTASAKTAVEPDGDSRSARKRKAILDAATEVFLRSGYLGTNMDEIAALSGVSKQTVYKHFSSKEALFIEIVTSMTGDAGDLVGHESSEFKDGDLGEYLFDYAHRQLSIVLTPRLMQLRRLVIGEVSRFPDLAKVLYERGPGPGDVRPCGEFRKPGETRPAQARRPEDGRLAFQLAGHVRRAEPGDAARRRRDPEAGRAAPPRRRRRACFPRRLWQEAVTRRPASSS